jgi:hypothetical protein
MVDSANSSASPILYKYVSIIGLRRILEGSIRFTQPSAFNDPFELLPEIIAPIEVRNGRFHYPFTFARNAAAHPQRRARRFLRDSVPAMRCLATSCNSSIT